MIIHINLPNLKSFKAGQYSFYNTLSLSLLSNSIEFYFSLNLPKLQSFQTGKESFYLTTSLSLSSRVFKLYYSIYLPNLQSFKTGDWSFWATKNLSIISNFSNSTLDNIFLIYNHSKQEIIHSIKQQVFLYRVILSDLI